MKRKDIKKKITPLFQNVWSPFATSSYATAGISSFAALENKTILVINGLINISGLVAVILIVVAAIMMITSGGDSEKFQKATGTITSAVVGLIVVFIAKLVIILVASRL